MKEPILILASGSPRRQELIRTFGLVCRIDPADVDETMPGRTPPDVLVEQLSLRKALKVKGRATEANGVVIGSDTVVVLDGRILGKPQDEQDAFDMLRSLAGRTHQVYTGLACIRTRADLTERDEQTPSICEVGSYSVIAVSPQGEPAGLVGCTVSSVTFRPMNDEEIRAYVKSGEPMDKAGAYGVQGLGAVFIEKIEGDFYSIMGLPLNLLYSMLLKLGISPFRG